MKFLLLLITSLAFTSILFADNTTESLKPSPTDSSLVAKNESEKKKTDAKKSAIPEADSQSKMKKSGCC